MSLPVFYTFRRCPYAMRARLALVASGVQVELREVLLRDKSPEFLATSPSGTVPCLDDAGTVIDESLDIMFWALRQRDPNGWLHMPDSAYDLIARADGPFKDALDKTKYHTRYDCDPRVERERAHGFISELNGLIADKPWLFGATPSLADMAILPFVRQFAFIEKSLFDAQDWPGVHRWLSAFLASGIFATIMPKYPKWEFGDAVTLFPPVAA